MKYPSEIVKEVAVYQCGTRGSCLCCNYCVGDISRENYVWNLPGERSGKKSWTRTVPWGPQYTVVSGVKVLDLSSCFLFCFLTLNTFYLFIFGCTTWFVGFLVPWAGIEPGPLSSESMVSLMLGHQGIPLSSCLSRFLLSALPNLSHIFWDLAH